MSLVMTLIMAVALATGSMKLLLPLARRIGLVDHPGGRKTHTTPTPLVGGIPILLGTWLTPLVWDYQVPTLLLIAAAAILLLGLVDDLRPGGLKPLPKLAGQFAAGCLAGIALFPDSPTAWLLFSFWAAILQNAINFQDNMDGLAPGAGLIMSLILALLPGPFTARLMAGCLAASMLPLLRFNFPRARLFLGDQGSLLLGFTLAVVTAYPGVDGQPDPARLLVAAMPLLDLVITTLYRLRLGLAPWIPGPHHLSNLLARLSGSKIMAVIILWLMTLITGTTLALSMGAID